VSLSPKPYDHAGVRMLSTQRDIKLFLRIEKLQTASKVRRGFGRYANAMDVSYAGRGKVTQLLKRLWPEDAGQDLTEYALLLMLICMTAVTAMGVFTSSLSSLCASTSNHVVSAADNKPSSSGLAGSFQSFGTVPSTSDLSGGSATKSEDLHTTKP
jgi:Flp pilus assembly pilin Flp